MQVDAFMIVMGIKMISCTRKTFLEMKWKCLIKKDENDKIYQDRTDSKTEGYSKWEIMR